MDGLRLLDAQDFVAPHRHRRTRRAPVVSHTGCLVCKTKKVKCDEARPSCTRCARNRWACSYIICPPPGLASSLDRTRITGRPGIARSALPPQTALLTQFFLAHQPEIISVADSPCLLQAFHADHGVRSTLLALTATYLRVFGLQQANLDLAEHYYRYGALSSFRQDLEKSKVTFDFTTTTPLLLRAVLLRILAFPLNEVAGGGKSHATDIISSNGMILSELGDWLSFQAGLRHVIRSFGFYGMQARDLLRTTLIGDNAIASDASATAASEEDLLETWMALLCPPQSQETREIIENVEWQSNRKEHFNDPAYIGPLHALSSIGLHATNSDSVNPFFAIAFLLKVTRSFRHRLRDQDLGAIWLYGRWTSLMCRSADTWWCRDRVRKDHGYMCAMLERRCNTGSNVDTAISRRILDDIRAPAPIGSQSNPRVLFAE